MKHIWIVLALAVASAGCAAAVRQTEDMLSAAGFRMIPADTPERRAQLAALPPRKFVVQQRDGQPVYVFADPKECNCLFVGDAKAYQEYQRLRLAKQVADEYYAMPHSALDWSMWGPWIPGRWP